MNSIASFFIFCSGIEKSVLKRCPTDRNKYIGIGATVFFTGLLAFISSSYAIYVIFQSYLAAVFFGLIWGAMIFNLDRYIVSSMKRKKSRFQDFWTAVPRLALAILLAIVISKPLELKVFDSEINAELSLMEQELYKEQEDKLRLRFDPEILAAQAEVDKLKGEIEVKRAKRDELNQLAIQEADGTGGSMQRNLGPIYKAKKADAKAAQVELDQINEKNQQLINDKLTFISNLEQEKTQANASLSRTELNGFAARLDALGRLSDKSETILWASLFFTFLFIAIETAPIFVKLISSKSPYDFVLNEHEYQFEMNHDLKSKLLFNKTDTAIQYDTELSYHTLREKLKLDKSAVSQAAKQELEELSKRALDLKTVLKNLNSMKS